MMDARVEMTAQAMHDGLRPAFRPEDINIEWEHMSEAGKDFYRRCARWHLAQLDAATADRAAMLAQELAQGTALSDAQSKVQP